MDNIAAALAYHQLAKHRFERYAPGPGYLDWLNQPDPFRRFAGAPQIPLDDIPLGPEPRWAPAFIEGRLPPAPVERASVSQLLRDSLALSAWKSTGPATWALRINPSSGNLHPTEGYLVCGPVPGLCEAPTVAHYAPRRHLLEHRTRLPDGLWQRMTRNAPPGTLFVGLASIHWREAWKYGERAYRYCQHDIGHAIAALAVAAAGLGWRCRLLDGWGEEELAALLGVADPAGCEQDAEPERPDCLLALLPAPGEPEPRAPDGLIAALAGVQWLGRPNVLSEERVPWPHLATVERACAKPPTDGLYPGAPAPLPPLPIGEEPDVSLRAVVHRRRSAVDMDGHTALPRPDFERILSKCLPGPARVPFAALPWRPQVHLVLFVHRVAGLDPGLYLLVRDPAEEPALRTALDADFEWIEPPDCPAHLPLRRLRTGDTRAAAKRLSCNQSIASHGAFAVAMLARFEPALRAHGAWFYPRLFWETGLIGQVLYLEAHAAGVAATGIGCYFDDPVHGLLGLRCMDWQVLYHFTVGGAVEDRRLTTLPPYPGPEGL